MGIGQALFEGWLLPIRSQLICIASETMTGSMVFAIFHAPPSGRPDDVRIQLTRDYGSSDYGKEGGEWVLKLPYHRSLSAVE